MTNEEMFKSKLPKNQTSLVYVSYKGTIDKALVEITKRGIVWVKFIPTAADMYSGFHRLRGNAYGRKAGDVKNVIVWQFTKKDGMKEFEGEPIEIIEIG